jgi:hypothetical protein
MTDMRALIKALEAVSGPDRLLDGNIAKALELQPAGWRRGTYKDDKCIWWDRSDKTGFTQWVAPRFTSSIDAALTLRSKHTRGWQWQTSGGYNENQFYARVWNDGYIAEPDFYIHVKSTAAIALSICFLKALDFEAALRSKDAEQ